MNSRARYGLQLATLFAVYLCTAKLGLTMDAVSGFATLIWAPTGIALAALLLYGYRLWPAIAAGAFVVNLWTGAPILVALLICVGNTLEALCGSYLLRERGFKPSLTRLRDVLNMILLAAFLSTVISATFGVGSLWLGGVIKADALRATWGAWWLGDALGVLLVTPLILVWSERKNFQWRIGLLSLIEMSAMVGALAVVALVVFNYTSLSMLATMPAPYFVFPILIWSALRFGVLSTVTTTFLIAVVSIYLTVTGVGPFARESLSDGLTLLHFFIGTVAVTALVLASAVAERVHSDRLTRASSERLAAEAKTRAILESAYDAFVSIDAQGKVTDWNRQAEATFGWHTTEVIGKDLAELIIPEQHRSAHRSGMRRFMASGVGPVLGKRIEMPAVHKDGHALPVELCITATKQGEQLFFNAFLHDISERKRIEKIQEVHLNVTRILTEATTEAQAFDSALINVCKGLEWDFGGFWRLDPEESVLTFANVWHNQSDPMLEFERVCRNRIFVRGQGLPGRVWESLQPTFEEDITMSANFPRAPAAVAAKLHGAIACPVMAGNEFIGVIEFFSHKFPSPDARLLAMMGDIGARVGAFVRRKRAEDALSEVQRGLETAVATRTKELVIAKDAADAANAAKSAFLANMSHEIRTPLGAVLGFSELILNQNLSRSERFNYAAAMRRNGELLSTIINDILDLSKVEAGKLEVDRHDVSVTEILTDISTLLSLQAAEKGIELTVSSDGPVPCTIKTDSLRLRQVLMNIVGNAIKFTKRGSVEVRIRKPLTVDGQAKLAFDIIDTGPGITPEQAKKLFEPFTQADVTTKRRHGGTGLGLVLARRLANLLGGDVLLTASTVGKGSTFRVTIDPGPLDKTTFETFAQQQREVEVIKPEQVSLAGLRVLLVEDAPDNRLLVGRMLTYAGAKVEMANNGQEALEMTKTHDYDVLLMDLQMPVMDGYEATAALRSGGFKTPIIALTAHALKEERQFCLDHGFSDHISKPVERRTLLESVARFGGPAANA